MSYPIVDKADMSCVLLGRVPETDDVLRFFLLIKRPGRTTGRLIEMQLEEMLDLIEDPVHSVV